VEYDVIIVGAGASGYFAAIQIAELSQNKSILILEKTGKTLTKVSVSGGGRCNVTHFSVSIAQLAKAYPRGEKFLKKAFFDFWVPSMIDWFKKHHVALNTEADNRMFPASNTSATIITLFENLANHYNILLQINSKVIDIRQFENTYLVQLEQGEVLKAKHLIIASGGHPKMEQFDYLKNLELNIIPTCPSLFTFNIPKQSINELMGLSVKTVVIKIEGEKKGNSGPVLITHWGFSGPAIIVLSALYAKQLYAKNYCFNFSIDWLPTYTYEQLFIYLKESKTGSKRLKNCGFIEIPQRLWLYLILNTGLDAEQMLCEISNANLNKLIEGIKNQIFVANGKTTFKEEFVTCGGIDLTEINYQTMESKKYKNLYFCGEVLDIDAVTGGYNFQSAWTTAFIAATHISTL